MEGNDEMECRTVVYEVGNQKNRIEIKPTGRVNFTVEEVDSHSNNNLHLTNK